MGCLNSGKSYFEIGNIDEKDLRKWEKDVGAFAVDFSQVFQRLMIDLKTIHPTIVKRVIESEFTSDFYAALNNTNFFKTTIKSDDGSNVEVFDFDKVVSFIYLLSAPGVLANKFTHYSDKAYYLFLRAKANEEDDLSIGLQKCEHLTNLITNFTQVACLGETRAFFKAKSMEEKGIVREFESKISGIADFIIEDLFTIKNEKVNSLSFKELKDKFGNDQFFMSSGYIREKAFDYLASQN